MPNSYLYVSIIYLFTQTIMVWLFAMYLRNPSIIDMFWSLGILVVGLLYLTPLLGSIRIQVIALLLIIWSVRLSAYLYFTRVRKGHVDKRYLALSANWSINKSLGYLANYFLQTVLTFIIATPFYFMNEHSILVDVLAFLLVVCGIIGETIADYQLTRFKKLNNGLVCNRGLWYYSRHPNYFFDFITWCGFALFADPYGLGLLSFISPITMYIIFVYLTGPMTERSSLQTRGHLYQDYQKITPMFFPKLH